MKYYFKEFKECPFCNSNKIKILGKRLNKSQGLRPHKKRGVSTTIEKCKQCELIYSNPMPIPNDISDHYGVPPENYWKPEYFVVNENYLSPVFKWMNEIQEIKKGSKILDIGAGIGKAMISLEKNGYDAYGLEPSEPFYKRAIEKMGIDNKKLILSTVEDASYEDNYFDVVILSAVLEHLYEPIEVIEKIMTWLKPNGLLFIEVPSSKWLTNRIYNSFYKLIGKDYVGNLSPMHEPYHLYEFSKKTFEKGAEKIGYEIADYQYYVCNTYLPKILDPFFRWYMKKTNTGMEIAIWLRKK